MEYKLALELKNAGFPQQKGDWYTSDGQWIPEEDRLYIPTFSEIIDELPKIHKIENYFDGRLTIKWAEDEVHIGYEHCDGWYEGPEGEGETSEIASAKLWLTLNAK